MASQNFDLLLDDIEVLSKDPEAKSLVDPYLNGDFAAVLQSSWARGLCQEYLEKQSKNVTGEHQGSVAILVVGLAAFHAFLQANVTGPPPTVESLLFAEDFSQTELSFARRQCLLSLDVDGLSVYQHIPHVELFWLARLIFTQYFPRVVQGQIYDSRWMRVRINAYHQRLLSTGPSNTRLTDSAISLQSQIDADLVALQETILVPGSNYSTEAKVQFLLEKAQIYIMQGLDIRVRESLQEAKTVSKFSYALSGALGKRTKFQQKDTSQLVVFAVSDAALEILPDAKKSPRPQQTISTTDDLSSSSVPFLKGPVALDLNDDTLLESIEYSKPLADDVEISFLPQELIQLRPDEQPQLNPLDQIILLTEATLKDTLSPLDKLNSEEILPYAVRVLNDKPTNWQIYTQALLVRSRIESHRSRTQERSVLQLQVLVDQIIADTGEEKPSSSSNAVPEIQVTSFIPRTKPSESAPVTERLRYIFQLNTPTRWEIETELAYAWSNVGSLVSALEIFTRLKLYPEVALCYHSIGQEDKARLIIRRQLYFSSKGPEMDQYAVNSEEFIAEEWAGEVRPTPPHAPRMWCILGDLDQDPECWQRAWDISKGRYARAQRTLGEYYARRGDLIKAREAYMKATAVNRQNGETWSRLGDIDLKVGNWDGAITAFQQSIMIDDSDAKTYSNLGSALISKHTETIALQRTDVDTRHDGFKKENDIDDEEPLLAKERDIPNPADLLRQALTAYKRGASLAHSNWQIWDNVITIALRMSPSSYSDILLATRSILQIRSPTIGEEAIDVHILIILINVVILQERPDTDSSSGVYNPRRGTFVRSLLDLIDTEMLPLITTRAELYTLISKLRFWTHDYVAALSCAEKAYRIAIADSIWLERLEKWRDVVAATENLVDALENYGPLGIAGANGEVVEKAWRSKARSALRSVLGKARDIWEGTEGLEGLEKRLRDL